jgi:PAS domain S-box-containing protein
MTTTLSQDILEHIVTQAPDAILYSDRDGIIRLWNQGAERIFGFSAHEAIGQSLDLIIPEAQRQRHWDGYHQTMATGHTQYGTKLLAVPALHQSGARLSTEFSIVMLRNDAGQPCGVAAIMRDVSARRAEEKALRDRLAAMETKVASMEGQ